MCDSFETFAKLQIPTFVILDGQHGEGVDLFVLCEWSDESSSQKFASGEFLQPLLEIDLPVLLRQTLVRHVAGGSEKF